MYIFDKLKTINIWGKLYSFVYKQNQNIKKLSSKDFFLFLLFSKPNCYCTIVNQVTYPETCKHQKNKKKQPKTPYASHALFNNSKSDNAQKNGIPIPPPTPQKENQMGNCTTVILDTDKKIWQKRNRTSYQSLINLESNWPLYKSKQRPIIESLNGTIEYS